MVKSDDQGIPDHFGYLGSIIHKVGKKMLFPIESEWVGLSGGGDSKFLCDWQILLELKGYFYKTFIRPAMLCGAECWATKKQHVN